MVATLLACRAEAPPPPAPPPEDSQPAAVPAESLASRPAAGVEIWFMEGRAAADSGGVPCFERTLEIRDQDSRRRVPLLYTLEAPTRLDDTSVRAWVYRNCRRVDPYRVSLRTGSPTPLPR